MLSSSKRLFLSYLIFVYNMKWFWKLVCWFFLASNGFVRADRILKLRKLLDELSSTAGLVNEEKGNSYMDVANERGL